MRSLLELLEARQDEAIQHMGHADTSLDPEILIYFARHYSHLGQAQTAIRASRSAADCGFPCSPLTLNSDPWFATVRTHPQFSFASHRWLDRATIRAAKKMFTFVHLHSMIGII